MERSEPTLVPEWLKNAGSSTGGVSISHSDDHAASRVARNKPFVNSNDHDFGRPSSSERTTSSYFRRSSSSNGSGNLRPYSSFGRNQRDRDWENDCYDSRDRDKSLFGDRRHRDFSDSLGNSFSSKFERDGLRRSQSMISGKRGDTWPKKILTDLGSASENNNTGLPTKGCLVGGVKKVTFDKDFPSLGADEKSAIPEVGRVPSPGISSAIQSLPIGSSATIGGEKWTSALAEVPVIVGSDGTSISSVQQATPSSTMPTTVGSNTTLNMAEAVAQGPSRAQAAPQLSIGTQRLEELALKQSRQLIPVTPSMPKALGLNSSDKQKIKVGQQQHPVVSLPVNHSPRGGTVKADFSKASNVGKLQFLKPVREKNGTTPVIKDTLGSQVVNATPAASATVSASAAARGPLHNVPADHHKPVLTLLEKRPTSQAKSRNDFFNLVRKKSMANTSVVDPAMANSSSVHDTGIPVSPSFSDKNDSDNPECEELPSGVSPRGNHLSEQRCELNCNGDACDVQKCVSNGGKHSSNCSEEEETAFLRSLGWDENEDEGGLTEEEIKGFYTKYINSRPSLKILQGVEPKFLSPIFSSSDAKLES